jgi:hypothetical protein
MRMIFLVPVVFMAPWALAQLPDPTRPPVQMMTPETGAGALPAESGMQTVIVRRNGRSGAVINGQYVEVGGKLGGKRVIRISESEVIVQGEGGRDVIRLIPSIEKKPVVKPAAKSVARRRPTGTGEQ